MKILESQSAVLTNLEVYQFLSAQAKEYQEQKRRGPPNLETLRKELLQYLEEFPSPLSQKPAPFDAEAGAGAAAGAAVVPRRLMARLRPYQLTKGELVMILNLRPTSIPTLNAVVEEMEARFAPEQQEDIVAGIAEVLGAFPAPPEGEGEGGEVGEGGGGEAMEITEGGSGGGQ